MFYNFIIFGQTDRYAHLQMFDRHIQKVDMMGMHLHAGILGKPSK